MRRATILRFVCLALCAFLLAPGPARARPVRVLYAGSLTDLMENDLGPAFSAATGLTFLGTPGGSTGLAHQIAANLRPADLFISASPRADALLMPPAAHKIDWYIVFARSPLVIGYAPQSRFAASLQRQPWYQVLQTPGLRLGRTDPELDPKGRLTLTLMRNAEAFYHQPGLAHAILGAPENPAQIRPEESLIGALQSGEIDVGIFYASETASLRIPSISLPEALAAAATYTAAIPTTAQNRAGAIAFLHFLLGPPGQARLRAHGLQTLKPRAVGAIAQIPPVLTSPTGD